MIKPVGGLILVKPDEKEDLTTQSGLFISAAFRETGLNKGSVVAIGGGEPNALNGELIRVPEFSEGDKVLYPDHTGHEVEDEDGKKYIIIHYKHIVGKVE